MYELLRRSLFSSWLAQAFISRLSPSRSLLKIPVLLVHPTHEPLFPPRTLPLQLPLISAN